MNQRPLNQPLISSYLLRFSISYFLICALVGGIITAISSNAHAGVVFVGLFGGASYTAQAFVREYRRAPNSTEKRQLIWGSLILIYIITLGLAWFLIKPLTGITPLQFVDIVRQALPPSWWLSIIVLANGMLWFGLFFCYSIMTETTYKALRRKGQL